ncbi:MAG: hormogonium polysaccharide biosynthesis protein HpsA [Actinomycetota bacterium]
MLKRKLVKVVQSLLRQVGKLSKAAAKRVMRSLMRSLMARSRRANLQIAGFVLPTVTMVLLVVVLLTVAITLRSFDRLNNARNFRVDQATLAAATPGIQRARAKLDRLVGSFSSTPNDYSLYTEFNKSQVVNGKKIYLYDFGDETRLKLVYDVNGNGTIDADPTSPPEAVLDLSKYENIKTAWRFPVDTDNDGKFDTFTLYAITFRSPSRITSDPDPNKVGQFNRARKPLDARTPPMPPGGSLSAICQAALGNASAVVGDSDWYKLEGKLKKSFFIYVANVPITQDYINTVIPGADQSKYQAGKISFSALELQQDRSRLPLNNNAVWFDDDIEISGVSGFSLNGRVFTNSNLLASTTNFNGPVAFYQVSDPNSCFYEMENSKIVVSGNIANGAVVADTTYDNTGNIFIHRFFGKGVTPPTPYESIDNTNNKTTTDSGGSLIGYNTRAYSERIGTLVTAALWLHDGAPPNPVGAYPNNVPIDETTVSAVAKYPKEVKDAFNKKVEDNPNGDKRAILKQVLEGYFKDRTRRVTFKEAPAGSSMATLLGALSAYYPLTSSNYQNVFSGSVILPPANWMKVATSESNDTPIDSQVGGFKYLKAQNPDQSPAPDKESLLGDRMVVGNGLPAYWMQDTGTVITDKGQTQNVANQVWQDSSGNNTTDQRTRKSQSDTLPDLGDTGRGGFWESEAGKKPKSYENSGGMRIVTGAGIYYRSGSSISQISATPLLNAHRPSSSPLVVWPDTMPMTVPQVDDPSTPAVDESTLPTPWPDLRMRATAVYHYAQNADADQKPIACVSSYYDPTNAITARNPQKWPDATGVALPDVSGGIDTNLTDTLGTIGKLADNSSPGTQPTATAGARSNNGVVYSTVSNRTQYSAELQEQAKLTFPNGRLVNKPLADALAKATAARTIADWSAIDAANCAIGILNGDLTVQAAPIIPHGAIKESAFLDGREVKSLTRQLRNLPATPTTANRLNWLQIADITKLRTDTDSSDLDGDGNNTNDDQYTLPLEQRQPLEVRVTDIDLNLLRKTSIAVTSVTSTNTEYLLPNSGIIYATRDDALPDVSSADDPANPANTLNSPSPKELLVSASDFKLDPSRRPNGIRLVNGSNLGRKDNTNTYRDIEKGLILISNVPTYIKANQEPGGLIGFNLHKDPDPSASSSGKIIEEFQNKLLTGSSFYGRSTAAADLGLDQRFACRQNQPGCSGTGDQWRPATIIADAITLLSNTFYDGFRSQGDYDLNNNLDTDTVVGSPAFTDTPVTTRLKNGFFYNNFVTSADWVGSSPSNPPYPQSSFQTSYLINGVTPVQRRANFPEYLMEVCPKLPVSECEKPKDWYVDLSSSDPSNWKHSWDLLGTSGTSAPYDATIYFTTASLPTDTAVLKYQGFPRRVAFRRKANPAAPTDPSIGELSSNGSTSISAPTSDSSNLVVLGINGTNFQVYPLNSNTVPPTKNNALWFQTTNSANFHPASGGTATVSYDKTNRLLIYQPIQDAKDQPLLVPVLNIHSAIGTPNSSVTTAFGGTAGDLNSSLHGSPWIKQASPGITIGGVANNPTIFNATFVARNSPSRPSPGAGEQGGGLPNFVRLLENWGASTASGTTRTVNISGNFIQSGQSQYATGPAQPADSSVGSASRLFYTLSGSKADYRWKDSYTGFLYRGGAFESRSPFYFPGKRQWGFDVGILSQVPDLFGQRFTSKTLAPSNEYFRGISQSDDWLKTLVCAGVDVNKTDNFQNKAVPNRDSSCLPLTNY